MERQVCLGLPEQEACLFLIRTYLYDVHAIKAIPAKRAALIHALQTMPPESRLYKGLANQLETILAWLQA